MERITIDNLPDGTKNKLIKMADKQKVLKMNETPNVMGMARKILLEGLKK